MRNRDDDEADLDERDDPDESDMDDGDDPGMAPCAYCGKPISEEADVCPHCGSYVSAEDAPRRYPWWLIVGAIAGLVAVLMWAL